MFTVGPIINSSEMSMIFTEQSRKKRDAEDDTDQPAALTQAGDASTTAKKSEVPYFISLACTTPF